MFTKDEKACHKATKKYGKAIKKFRLDNIEDGWGQSKKRYMLDSFISGFYCGRDYEKDKKEKYNESNNKQRP